MTNKQFRNALRAWMGGYWSQHRTRIMEEATAADQVFQKHFAEHLASVDSDTPPVLVIPLPTYRNSRMTPAVLRAWMNRPAYVSAAREHLPGLPTGTYKFVDVTIGTTRFTFREDRLPYHAKKLFKIELK